MVNKQSSLIFLFSCFSLYAQPDPQLEKLQEQITALYTQRSELLQSLEQLKFSEDSIKRDQVLKIGEIEQQKEHQKHLQKAYQDKINQAVYWHYNQHKFYLKQFQSQKSMNIDGTALCQYMTKKSLEDFGALTRNLKILEQSYADLESQGIKISSLKSSHLELLNKLDEEEKFLIQYIEEHHREKERQEKLKQKAEGETQSVGLALDAEIEPFNLAKLAQPLTMMQNRERHDFLGAQIFQAELGESIHAVADGTVIFSDALKGLGQMAIIEHSDGYMSLYANCQSLHVSQGDIVQKDSLIATVGNSGQLGQEALYFELRNKGQIIQSPEQWQQ